MAESQNAPIPEHHGTSERIARIGTNMHQTFATVALLVADYDEALAFYRDVLGFALVADTPLGDGKRWLVVAPNGGTGAHLLLAKAEGAAQKARIGDQTGGRVGFFLETDDFARDHEGFISRGVRFLEAPRHEPYGTVAVFEDLYGNKWDLIEPRRQPTS
jgi:catechol 2,3-dioxygenase-like lactoylglutathione lyase family enzyme